MKNKRGRSVTSDPGNGPVPEDLSLFKLSPVRIAVLQGHSYLSIKMSKNKCHGDAC